MLKLGLGFSSAVRASLPAVRPPPHIPPRTDSPSWQAIPKVLSSPVGIPSPPGPALPGAAGGFLPGAVGQPLGPPWERGHAWERGAAPRPALLHPPALPARCLRARRSCHLPGVSIGEGFLKGAS